MQTIRIHLNIHHCYISYVKKKIKALKAKTPQKKITVNRYLLTPQQNIVFFNIMKCYLLLKQQILFSAKERAKCFFLLYQVHVQYLKLNHLGQKIPKRQLML